MSKFATSADRDRAILQALERAEAYAEELQKAARYAIEHGDHSRTEAVAWLEAALAKKPQTGHEIVHPQNPNPSGHRTGEPSAHQSGALAGEGSGPVGLGPINSRSQLRRLAVMKGEPMPEFGPKGSHAVVRLDATEEFFDWIAEYRSINAADIGIMAGRYDHFDMAECFAAGVGLGQRSLSQCLPQPTDQWRQCNRCAWAFDAAKHDGMLWCPECESHDTRSVSAPKLRGHAQVRVEEPK